MYCWHRLQKRNPNLDDESEFTNPERTDTQIMTSYPKGTSSTRRPLSSQDLTTRVQELQDRVKSLLDRVGSNELPTSTGISLLDVKIHLLDVKIHHNLLSYIITLTCIDRLVELRVVPEKVRSLELKLIYQIDKLVSLAATQAESKDDGAKEDVKNDTTAAVVEDPLRFQTQPNEPCLEMPLRADRVVETTRTSLIPRASRRLVPMCDDDDPKQAAASRLSARMRERASAGPAVRGGYLCEAGGDKG
ncbi:hypothetical protein BJ742DRAFT_744751 [Cladochytrium replicatum]|nr:hypothetical protein BJ742DRAFT_744751 [Cladochytrium replicatum]